MVTRGCDRARRATAIESKPTVVPKLDVIERVTPRRTLVPARPASAPLNVIVAIVISLGRMPAYLEASGLAPTARTSKPQVVRNSSHQTKNAAPSASRIPRWPLRPRITGKAALPTSKVTGDGDLGTLSGPLTSAARSCTAT